MLAFSLCLLAFATVPSLLHATPSGPRSAAEISAYKARGWRRIETSTTKATWMAPQDVDKLIFDDKCGGFMDVTDSVSIAQDRTARPRSSSNLFPKNAAITQTSRVTKLIPSLQVDNLKTFITHFVSYPNRFYTTDDGVKAAEWIHDSARRYTPDVSFFNHTWAQPSVIARIPGSDPALKDQVIILGAHLDSISKWTTTFDMKRPLQPKRTMIAPGADDDASGSATLMEVLRVLSASGFRPKKTLEFHWYSAEEVGLLGSQAIAQSYKKSNKQVTAMLQLDMTGYVKKGEGAGSVGILTDFTDPNLADFMVKIVEAYASIPWVKFKCGYGCSDHASWNRVDFPSAHTHEAQMDNDNHDLHTDKDTMALLNYPHMMEFCRIALGFVIELTA